MNKKCFIYLFFFFIIFLYTCSNALNIYITHFFKLIQNKTILVNRRCFELNIDFVQPKKWPQLHQLWPLFGWIFVDSAINRTYVDFFFIFLLIVKAGFMSTFLIIPCNFCPVRFMFNINSTR